MQFAAHNAQVRPLRSFRVASQVTPPSSRQHASRPHCRSKCDVGTTCAVSRCQSHPRARLVAVGVPGTFCDKWYRGLPNCATRVPIAIRRCPLGFRLQAAGSRLQISGSRVQDVGSNLPPKPAACRLKPELPAAAHLQNHGPFARIRVFLRRSPRWGECVRERRSVHDHCIHLLECERGCRHV